MVSMIWLENRNINLEMVQEGYAEAYREYLKEPYSSEFLDAEQKAKAERDLGIEQLRKTKRFRKSQSVRGD